MSFDILPDEILSKILCCLMDEPKSYVNLASCCKRFCLIADQIIYTSDWLNKRPLAFDLYLNLSLYRPSYCNEHGICAEQESRDGSSCEIESRCAIQDTNQSRYESSINERQQANDLADSEDSQSLGEIICYRHRLFCLLNAKYRSFSTLRFKDARLADRGCVKLYHHSIGLNRVTMEHKIRALVELELYSCDINLDWLNTILNQLTNVAYLTLDQVSFIDPTILVESRFLASRKLNRLRITGDRLFRMNDSIFMFFLENFPAIELDLTATRVEYHKRIIQRFYTNHTLDLHSVRPSEYILTFSMILLYLKKYQAVIRHFIADETNITFASLKRILQDDDLKQLTITIKNCPMITPFERARLAEMVNEDDLARVNF